MPIYEYTCRKGHEFEAFQKITDKPLEKCEKCGARAKRLISNTSFQLKGSGWYVTDYAGKKPGPEKEEKKESSGKKEETSKEKPATSKEGKSE